jgi:hypothetical protein
MFEAAAIEAPWLVVEGDRMWPDPARAADVFFADCDEETQRAAVERLRPMCTVPHGDPASAAAWREIPSTYVLCSEDRAIPVSAQRGFFAPRTTEVVELATSHSPFYSEPDALADLVGART